MDEVDRAAGVAGNAAAPDPLADDALPVGGADVDRFAPGAGQGGAEGVHHPGDDLPGGPQSPRLIGREEPYLLQRQGVAYDAYCERVPRLIPRLRPAVIGSGSKADWLQGLLSEIYVVGAMLTLATVGWTEGFAWDTSLWHVVPLDQDARKKQNSNNAHCYKAAWAQADTTCTRIFALNSSNGKNG